MPVDLDQLQREVGDWSFQQFGVDQPDLYPLLGVSEEYGELVHSVLKIQQGIRLDDEDVGKEAEKDAVGDMIVYLLDFCERRGLDASECVEKAWGEVSKREWDSDVVGVENGRENLKEHEDGFTHGLEGYFVVAKSEDSARAGPFRNDEAAIREREHLNEAVEGLTFEVVPGTAL